MSNYYGLLHRDFERSSYGFYLDWLIIYGRDYSINELQEEIETWYKDGAIYNSLNKILTEKKQELFFLWKA